MYGLKTAVSVISTGLCIRDRKHVEGSVYDILIFKKSLAWHRSVLRKNDDDVVSTRLMGDYFEY